MVTLFATTRTREAKGRGGGSSPLSLMSWGGHIYVKPPPATGRRAGHEFLDVIRDELSGARYLSIRAVCHGVLHVRDG